jgi:hypothetical protein
MHSSVRVSSVLRTVSTCVFNCVQVNDPSDVTKKIDDYWGPSQVSHMCRWLNVCVDPCQARAVHINNGAFMVLLLKPWQCSNAWMCAQPNLRRF